MPSVLLQVMGQTDYRFGGATTGLDCSGLTRASARQVPHVPLIVRWREQMKLLMEAGELPDDWDEVDMPRIRPGVSLRSLRKKRVSGGVMGRGGIVYERAAEGWWTVEVYQGSAHRTLVADDDVDTVQYSGEVNVRDLEYQRRAIAACLAHPRNNYDSSFLGALQVITAVLESPERCSNSDGAVRS